MPQIIALKCNKIDNVAVIFSENAQKGNVVSVRDGCGNSEELVLSDDIPYGHKVAIKQIDFERPIYKYGESIGVATKIITIGSHVHIHNLDSQRSRGDLLGKE